MMSILIDLAARVKAHDRRIQRVPQQDKQVLASRATRLGSSADSSGLPPTFTLPLDPRFESRGLLPKKCKVMGSAQRPLWLEFENADHCSRWPSSQNW